MKRPRLIQNPKSKHASPTTLAFDVHYAQLRIIDRWDRDRYNRLCIALNLTHHELASLICWKHSSVEYALENSTFPGPVCLLLTLLEAQVMQHLSTDIIAQPFPQNGLPQSA